MRIGFNTRVGYSSRVGIGGAGAESGFTATAGSSAGFTPLVGRASSFLAQTNAAGTVPTTLAAYLGTFLARSNAAASLASSVGWSSAFTARANAAASFLGVRGVVMDFLADTDAAGSFKAQVGWVEGFLADTDATGSFDPTVGWLGSFAGSSSSSMLADLVRQQLLENNALLYWDFQAGITPVRGAARAFFSRDSSGTIVAPNLTYTEVVRDSPRVQFVTVGREKLVGILLEPAGINPVIRNVDFGTNGTAGWTKSGDAAATLTVVDDTAMLARGGLGEIVPDGKVLCLDNSAGTTTAWATNGAAIGSTVPHRAQCFMRATGTGPHGTIKTNGVAGTNNNLPATYARITIALTPAAVGNSFQVQAAPGAVVYFVLPMIEPGTITNEVIRNPGAGAMVRGADLLYADGPPQATTIRAVYARFLGAQANNGGVTGARILEFSDAAGAAPRLALRFTTTGVDVLLDNGTAQATVAVTLAGITTSSLVDVAAVLNTDGSGTLLAALAGGDPVVATWAAPAGGLPVNWTRVWWGSSGAVAASRIIPLTLKVANTLISADSTYWMRELREFVLEPNGLALPLE